MKRITALLVVMMLLTGFTALAESAPDDVWESEFEYNQNGTLVSYHGGEVVSVPVKINDTEIRKIGDGLFFDADISTVYTGEGMEQIGESAFENSRVSYADLAATVTYVADRAFANCADLTDVVLNSDQITFGYDVFMGTGHINFTVPCTADLTVLEDKISDAKGDNNFSFVKMHTALIESMTETDIYGENMLYCEACGFKGSKYLDDISIPFEDVSQDAWYYSYVATAYDFGILSGKTKSVFDPDAGLTCAEAAKMAACIYSYQTADEYQFEHRGENWYDVYVDYCYQKGIIEENVTFDWEQNATRAQMAYLFSRCDAKPYYINEIPLTDIPDVYDTTEFAYEILDLYCKGIAVGSNQFYAYYPDSDVKRSEAAAFVSRILRWDMRIALPKG